MFNFLLNKKKEEKYRKNIQQIKEFEKVIANYSDSELKKQTHKLKQQLNNGLNLDQIIAEALATVKEAIKRSTGIVLFDVQIMGSIVLHEGKIAEMKTGEGKTLVAISCAYLNALAEKGVQIITVNDYLAKRDATLARQIYNYLNMTVGLVESSTTSAERRKQYYNDLVYITNSELGFDYLRDNMTVDKNSIVQQRFNFAIIDEVDSILIDEARTPLIISGPFQAATGKYEKSKNAAVALQKNVHYEIDEKARNISLTETGISKCEEILEVDNLYNINNSWTQYILNAIKAKELFLKNVHYIVKNDQIIIVDEFTGRIMEGRRWSDGLHQAIEAKENTRIQQENKTLASITYQNLFLIYQKLAGMTGTAKTEETELDKIYRLEVVEIPTNKICQRKDLPDLVYKTEYAKWHAIANECFDMYQIGRPALIGTTNVEKSELLANMLSKLNVPYNLLNAKPENVARESEIISQAGRKRAITISTNMAGRGTDIILGGNAYSISKIIIINYIKNKLRLDTSFDFNSIDNNIYSILQELDTQKIDKNIDINEYVEKAINTRKNMRKSNRPIYDIYKKILNYYISIFQKEKEEVLQLGGLYVIGTERHESRRIDNQLRGRSGRQGDTGSSRFFLSLQDNLLRIFGGDKIFNLMQTLSIDNNTPIESPILSKSLDSAQKKIESYFFDIRKQLFEYDEVINNQRQAIYAERRRILESNFTRDCILEYGESTINEILSAYKKQESIDNKRMLLKQIKRLLNLTENFNINSVIIMNNEQIEVFLYEQLRISYDLRESYLEQLRPGLIRQLEKYYLLQQIDKAWQEHIEKMTLLRESIGWRSYGQQDPLIEYKNEGFNLFINMVTYIRQTVVYLTMRSRLIVNIKQ
uniref:Protein translocase subunit SecA n=1 Tax=Rhodymenia pseudopalmata TaxID=31502 RepID=A0A1C9C7L5_RHOPU|nr:preprotein translocase subunit SecA [Rhodymenia pseudopalmata]AOM64369.1 preprotein translocase subunit SecA [Rhodymenia pseudopalmata]